jgi:hypothetical protein
LINQNTYISQQISSWNQMGSRIIRGNLLVVPIENSLLYVSPLCLRAEQGQLPELKRVIPAYGDRVVMQETPAAALPLIDGLALTCRFPRLCRPLIFLMLARVAHHFEASQKLDVAWRAAHVHGADALGSLSRWSFCPILLQVFVRGFLARHAVFDASAFAARRQGHGLATCCPNIVTRDCVGNLDHQAQSCDEHRRRNHEAFSPRGRYLKRRLSARPAAPLLLILLPDWSPIWISEDQRTEKTRFFAASPD